MKSALLQLVLAFMVAGVVHAHGMKIATVDAGKIFSHWDYTIRFEDKLEKLREDNEDKNTQRLEVIKGLHLKREQIAATYQRQRTSLSPEQKERLNNAYKNLGRELKALEQDRSDFRDKESRKLADLEASTSKFILERINRTIGVYAKQHQFDMVIDMQGCTTSGLPFFLHLGGAIDITDKIITKLNLNDP